ncbi:MAG: septum site-determining protein MinC [Gammaproteobacteria bacterium]
MAEQLKQDMPTPPLSFRILDYRLPTVSFATDDLSLAKERLSRLINKHPEVFDDLGVLVSFETTGCENLDKHEALELVRNLKMRPLAVTGASAAEGEGLPRITPVDENQSDKPAAPAAAPSKDAADDVIIKSPVRSGQRIFSQGNLVVMGSVSSGAELLANGSIFVFGTLGGRALAGLQGERHASILCHDMQAEVIAIAGVYLLGEEIDKQHLGKVTQVTLGEELVLESVG